jgi:hypothetical protein
MPTNTSLCDSMIKTGQKQHVYFRTVQDIFRPKVANPYTTTKSKSSSWVLQWWNDKTSFQSGNGWGVSSRTAIDIVIWLVVVFRVAHVAIVRQGRNRVQDVQALVRPYPFLM